jgi:replication-associated recombination protein RarA
VIAEVTVPAADVTVAAAEVTVPAAEVTVAAAEVTVAAAEVTVADVPAAEHSVAAVPGAEVEAAAAQIPAQVDSEGSQFHYVSGRTPQKQGPYSNADLPDQREYMGRKLDQMRYNSPGSNQYIGEILYSPGKRTYMSTPHPDYKSVSFRIPVCNMHSIF